MCSDCTESEFFMAPSNIEGTCSVCGAAIKPGEMITESDFSGYFFIHEACSHGEEE